LWCPDAAVLLHGAEHVDRLVDGKYALGVAVADGALATSEVEGAPPREIEGPSFPVFLSKRFTTCLASTSAPSALTTTDPLSSSTAKGANCSFWATTSERRFDPTSSSSWRSRSIYSRVTFEE
jgi:hypothetical protein